MSTVHYPTCYKLATDGKSYIVGDDSGREPNALDANAQGKLIIPKTYQGLPITIIGQFAFRLCRKITEIDIQADITQIKKRAFSDMNGLKEVTLPSSLQRIEDYGLQFSNNGGVSGNVKITFGENSQLSYIGCEVFGFKNNVIIYYTSNKSPQCHSNVFPSVTSKVILAPTEFTFCNQYLTVLQTTILQNDCKTLIIKDKTYPPSTFLLIYLLK